MSEQLRMEREDWISRFFGFLGSFQYVRQKRPVSYPFSLYGKEVGESIEESDRTHGKLVDNIVYIYGVPESGKSTYRRMLLEELPSDLYRCMTFDFQKQSGRLSNDDFCKLFSGFWMEQEKLDFEFPCTKLSYGEEKVGKSVYAEILWETYKAVNDIRKGSIPEKVDGIRYFVDGGKRLLEMGDEALTKSETTMYEKMKMELRAAAKDGKAIDMSPTKEDPYLYLKMDLNANLKRYMGGKDAKKIICFVDSFECYADVTGQDAMKLLDYHPFMEFMASVPDVIWVVFGPKRPSEAIRKYVPAENCWCMKGARKESVIKFLTYKCPDATDKWRAEVYRRTAGYVPLLRYCVENLKKFPINEDADWDKIKQLAESLNISPDKLVEQYGLHAKKPKDMDLWFDCLWKANWSAWKGDAYIPVDKMSPEQQEEYIVRDVLSKMYETEYAHAINDSTERLGFFLPTLAYLVKKSSDNVGTLQQFSWRRKGKFAELNSTGQGHVNSISSTTPFCLEFVEYPEHLYLDPVFISIMQQNSHYEEWFSLFEENCFIKVVELEDNDGSLEGAERAKDSVQDMGATKRKKNKIREDIIVDEHTQVDDSRYESIDVTEKTDKPVEESKEDSQESGQKRPGSEQAAEASKHLNESDKVDEAGVDKSKSQGKGTTPERNLYVYTLADDAWKDIVWGDKALPNNPPDK